MLSFQSCAFDIALLLLRHTVRLKRKELTSSAPRAQPNRSAERISIDGIQLRKQLREISTYFRGEFLLLLVKSDN